MKIFFCVLALTVSFFCATAQLVSSDTINITNVKTDKYQYLPFTKCFFLMPPGFKNRFSIGSTFIASSFYNDSGSFINNIYEGNMGYKHHFDTIPYMPIDSMGGFFHAGKKSAEYFKINGFNATLVDIQNSYSSIYYLLIGNKSFSAYVYALYKNQTDKDAIRNALLSVYPDTLFRKKYPSEEFTKLKYFPEVDTGAIHKLFGEGYYHDIDSCLRINAYLKYYNMFVDFDDFASFFIQANSDYESKKQIRNIKVVKKGKINILEYDKIFEINHRPLIAYGAFMTCNFKMLEIESSAKNYSLEFQSPECLSPESYPKYKRKCQEFLKTINIE